MYPSPASLSAVDLERLFESTLASETFFNATVIAGCLWLAVTGFMAWRRQAANLTPVSSGPVGRGDSPDFLKVDHAARATALERGDTYERELTAREIQAAAASDPASSTERIGGTLALFMSGFTLVSMVFGSVMQVRWIGHYAEDLSAPGRIAEIVRAHPVAFGVAIAVALLQVVRFARSRRTS